ncbi:MAG: amidohydrolase family protein [Acidobacteria bacterium]|nr:amidohydrolase family protein [Acidobacteriota bacterium]
MRFRLLSLLFVLAGLLLLTPASAALQDDGDAEEKDEGLPLAASDTLSFTVTEGTWMSLDVSPDGQTIVFELLGDLYTLPTTGGAATRIMGGISFESQPVFSPDGSEIAFVSDRNGVENLWIANADGSEPRAVTKDGPTRDRPQLMVSPSWTADGNYLLVSKSRPPERTAAVFLIHRDGGTGVRLGDKPPEPTPGVPGSQPPNRLGAVASADGRHVYVSERRGSFNYNAQFPIWQVVRFDRETGEETTITSAPGSAMRPLLHPDGRHLVYATRHRTRTALRVRDLETGEERWLANGVTRDDQESRASRDTMPGYAFTPDGSALIATVDGGFRRIDFETGAMTAIPFEAQVEAEVAPRLYFPRRVDDGPTVTARIIRWPRVAPDGSAVVFSAFSRLYRMDLPAGTPARLTDSDEDEFMPAWSPDGNRVAYVTWSSTGGHLKTVPAAGGSGTALTSDPAFYAEPAWNPAGDAIVVRRAPVKEHLYSFLREGSGKTDLYADEDEIGGMRPAELSELLLVPAAGGDLSVIGPAEGGRFPHFTNDPERVYLTGSSAGLYSLQLDGSDRKTHLKVTGRGAGATPPPASQIMLSPDGDRAFFELQNRHYLVEVPSFGKNTLEIKVGAGENPVPVREVAPEGGDHLAWSASGDAVVWSLGNTIHRQDASAIGGDEDLAPDTFDAVVTEPRARPSGRILLKDAAQVLTMNGEEIIPGGDVLVEDNRIAAVGPDLDAPEGARVFDVSGKTVMPGYVDAHAHMWAPRGVHQRQVFQHLANLAYGVTTTRDPQTSTADVFAYRDLQEIGRILAPRIYATGPGIFSRSGVYDADAADDFLKRYAEAYDAVTIKQYIAGDRIVRQWVAMASMKHKLIPTTEGALDLKLNLTQMADGYSGHEHSLPIIPIYDDVAQYVARTDTYYTPTILVAYGGPWSENYYFQNTDVVGDEKLARFIPAAILDNMMRRRGQWFLPEEYVHEGISEGCMKVMRAGGRCALGSHGQLQGLGAHWEIWAMQSGGLTEHETLIAATFFGAEAIGFPEDLGTLEAGKLADIQILDADPLADIRNTNSVRFVMLNGELFDANTMAQLWPVERPAPDRFWVDDNPPTGPANQ